MEFLVKTLPASSSGHASRTPMMFLMSQIAFPPWIPRGQTVLAAQAHREILFISPVYLNLLKIASAGACLFD